MAQFSEQSDDTTGQYTEKEDSRIRESWTVNSFCSIYSRSRNKWFDGLIKQIEYTDNKEWLIVLYNKKTKKIQRHCIDIKAVPSNHASLFCVGSICKIYSRNKWCNGQVLEIFRDSEGEWLRIKYSEKGCVKICDIQRYNREIKLIKNINYLSDIDKDTNSNPMSLKNIWKTHAKAMEAWLKKENEENVRKPWTLLSTNNLLHRTIKYSNIIALNDYEFMVAPYQSFENPLKNNGIYKYNIMENTWKLLILYPKQFVAEQHYICMDYENKCIYIYYYLGALCKIFIETQSFEWFQPKNDDDYKMEGDAAIFGEGALSIVIENKLNIFWSKDSTTHQIYNDNTKELGIIKLFDFNDGSKGRISYGMIYNKSEEYILLFGGFKGTGFGRSDEIWKYIINNGEWQKLGTVLPDKMQSFACVIDLNCKYVFILGGSDSKGFSQNIYILNLFTMNWNKSNIICPLKGVNTGSVVITKSNNDDNDEQFIHILQGNFRHFQVSLSDILAY